MSPSRSLDDRSRPSLGESDAGADSRPIVHEPDNIRVSSGWAKDCCYFLIPMYVHIVY